MESKNNINLDTIPSETISVKASDPIILWGLQIIPEDDYIEKTCEIKIGQKITKTKAVKNLYPFLLSYRGERFKTQINFNIKDSLKTLLDKFAKF